MIRDPRQPVDYIPAAPMSGPGPALWVGSILVGSILALGAVLFFYMIGAMR